MLGEIVYEAGPEADMDYDIVLEERSGHPQRVHKLHPSYMSLQFPLLFLYGDDSYQKEMKMVGSNGSSTIHIIFMINHFIRKHQNDIRNEYLSGIYDAINRGDNDGSDYGSRLIVPQLFTGGPRYMYNHYLDALAICCVHGNPSYFITFTCNVKWPEITYYMAQFPLLTTTDRADVVDRVFEMKIHQFVAYLRDSQPFRKVIAVLYTVEFQKRGLPHCHTLLWIDESRIPPLHVCKTVVSAKKFPKEYCTRTYVDKSGFVHYKRRAVDATMMRQGVELDNGYVVPYNRRLLIAFYAHINVEYCGWTMLIKYRFKYISKGTDHVVSGIARNTTNVQTALGLLQDDQDWEITLEEATLTATPTELRALLAYILAFCKVSDPKRLWQRTWRSMSEDIPYVSSISLNILGLHIDDSELEDYVLYEFEGCLNRCSRSLTDFGLRLPPEHLMSVLRNRLLMEEKSYDQQSLAAERDQLLPKLNEKQLYIFNLIMNVCRNNQQELVFIYGHGGTGKTFLWKATLYTLRSEGKIVLAIASSGISSLCFETLDKTLRDVLDEPNRIFRGKSVMLGGDFRQTLPVKKAASRDETIRSSVAKSYLWPHFKVHYLTENMRLNNENFSDVDRQRMSSFAQWLLDIGNG
nr:DNA helicase [Tanacetum cinerariifolium]